MVGKGCSSDTLSKNIKFQVAPFSRESFNGIRKKNRVTLKEVTFFYNISSLKHELNCHYKKKSNSQISPNFEQSTHL